MNNKSILIISITLILINSRYSLADNNEDESYAKRIALSQMIRKMRAMRKDLPIPPTAGLFGVYAFPKKGQFVTGINYQTFKFNGLIQGNDSISAKTAVTSAPNIFFGAPNQPPTLRAVPKSAEAHVVYPFINYAINDHFSWVGLIPLIRKKTVLYSLIV